MYKLTITKTIENKNYESEVKSDSLYPQKFIVDKYLEVEITDEQFDAIRKAVLEQF